MAPIPDPSDILRSVERFRAQVLARDEAAMRRLSREWVRVERRLMDTITALSREAADAVANGAAVDRNLILRLRRAEDLYRQVHKELSGYGAVVDKVVTENQRQMIRLAGESTVETLRWAGALQAGFNYLPANAFESMIGQVAEGGPLFDYFMRTLPSDAIVEMGQALADGLARGKNPKVTAGLMRDALGIGHKRALAISRTETLRAYRHAQLANYRQTNIGATGWKWICAKQRRTCVSCLAKDGQIFPLDQEFVDHPQGRCSSVLVIPGREFAWKTGREWFKEQPEAVQKTMMGTAKYRAWKGNQIAFDDLSQPHTSATFGTHYAVASMDEALANAERRRGGL